MKKYVWYALSYVAVVLSWSGVVALLNSKSNLGFDLGVAAVIGLLALLVKITRSLLDQIKTDLELLDIVSKL